ncbi:SAVED domain-containing protein [Ralstonia wenshanensis]|uniref:SAVED domain-containing protein n=1 Tax=Ralstonia wenshanensis TaxID=2842456 RepID=UPI001E32B4C7|nr:SAVED domain-containing protein [Ralstonia wenshanensis]UGS90967.1 SAVED domain-containing protein [Ralstonia wenshanensis]
MARTQERAYISVDVRRDLWVAAGGRCEFRGCCKPVDRDFLTKKKCIVGEYAHIIADSPGGARGIPGESERLAKDPRNLMLACFDCHSRIDRHGQNNEYTPEQLRAMKREHEARIERIYSATGVRESLPILMSFPVGAHVPVVELGQVHHAMLENSGYTCFPVDNHINIDRADFDILDDSPDFWPRAERVVADAYERRIQPEITARGGVPHITIAAFAPIPMLMKLGSLLGDKTEAMVLDLPGDRWLWDKRPECSAPQFTYDVPDTLPREVAAVVSISNRAVHPATARVVEFRALEPNRGIIRNEEHLQAFRREFNSFLMRLVRAGVRVLHLYPATPLSASVEIGRMLLPKTFEEVHVWEWKAPTWKAAVRLK